MEGGRLHYGFLFKSPFLLPNLMSTELEVQVNTTIPEAGILGIQISFCAVNITLSQSFNNVVELYRVPNSCHSFRRNRQQLFTEAALYSEHIHPVVLCLAEMFKYISRTSLESAVFMSPTLLAQVSHDCLKAKKLADGLERVCLKFLGQLDVFASELEQERRGQGQDCIKYTVDPLEKIRDAVGKGVFQSA